ncbi:hypothetical protein BC829DRAFT_383159 [Chytridium lagenaria]|nr:hypothetical protein BC829DRAFT_383159 [Chytridium lagenaria]
MVDCVKVFLFVFLLPFPLAPSVFLFFFLAALLMEHQPCLYCLVLIFAFLRSSCTLYGSGPDYMGHGSTRCWVDLDFLFDARPHGLIFRDRADPVSTGAFSVSYNSAAIQEVEKGPKMPETVMVSMQARAEATEVLGKDTSPFAGDGQGATVVAPVS